MRAGVELASVLIPVHLQDLLACCASGRRARGLFRLLVCVRLRARCYASVSVLGLVSGRVLLHPCAWVISFPTASGCDVLSVRPLIWLR